MQDKRQHLRWSISLPVKYRISGQEKEFSSEARDISHGGICIYPAEGLSEGTNLDIRIDMPGDVGSINASGKPVWQSGAAREEKKDFSCGIKFLSLTYSDKEKIYKYLYRYKHKELISHWWSAI